MRIALFFAATLSFIILMQSSANARPGEVCIYDANCSGRDGYPEKCVNGACYGPAGYVGDDHELKLMCAFPGELCFTTDPQPCCSGFCVSDVCE